MKKGMFIFVAIVLFIIAIGSSIVGGTIGANNHAIELEEKINESLSNIDTNKRKAISQLNLIADSIDSSDAQYLEVIEAITDARTSDLAPDEVGIAISVIMEAYPDEPGNASLYKEQITSIRIATEELFRYRELYNSDVKEYKNYTRKIVKKIFLSFSGYETIDYEYLKFEFEEGSDLGL